MKKFELMVDNFSSFEEISTLKEVDKTYIPSLFPTETYTEFYFNESSLGPDIENIVYKNLFEYENISLSSSLNDSQEEVNGKLWVEGNPFINQSSRNVFESYPPELMDFAAISFTIFSIFGVFGNFISIWALSRCKRLRNATTTFIVNLCAADLLLCCFSMPMSALSFFERGWSYGEVLCTLFPLIRYSNGAVSLESLIAITVNRYILIVHPNIYPKVYSKLYVVLMVASIWMSTLITLLFPLLKIWGRFGYDPKVGTCTILPLNGKSPKTFYYILGSVLPSTIIVACYLRIYCAVRHSSETIRKSCMPTRVSKGVSFSEKRWWVHRSFRHSEMTPDKPKNKQTRKDLRILKVMLVVFLTFILTFFPVSFVKIFRKEDDLPITNVFGYLGVYFSSIVNPVIYIIMSKEYRKAYAELFYRKNDPYSKHKRSVIV